MKPIFCEPAQQRLTMPPTIKSVLSHTPGDRQLCQDYHGATDATSRTMAANALDARFRPLALAAAARFNKGKFRSEEFEEVVVQDALVKFFNAVKRRGAVDEADATAEVKDGPIAYPCKLLRWIVGKGCLDRVRSLRSAQLIDDDGADGLPYKGESPDAAAERTELQLAIADCLQRLAALGPIGLRRAVVLRLHWIDGVPMQEIANRYNIPRAIIWADNMRGKAALGECLAARGFGRDE